MYASSVHYININLMRNISFFLTQRQVRDQTKTVTRRQGWKWLTPGTLLQPVEKGQGLKKGEKVQRIGPPIRVVSVGQDPLYTVDPEECRKEGFPNMKPSAFVSFYCEHNKCGRNDSVTRIEFEYVNDHPATPTP
jgi:hypothetical protein